MIAKFSRRLVLVASFCIGISTNILHAKPVHYTLAGASPSGLWTLLGTGIDSAVKNNIPGSTITYQTTGGGFANAAMVEQGRSQLGLIHDAELAIAIEGTEPFRKPMSKLRVIGYLYDWAPMQFVANKKFADQHDINSLSDLTEKKAPVKITVNRAGNITGRIATAILDEVGATPDAVDQWGGNVITAGSSEQSTLFQNGRVNVFTNGVFVGHSSIRELENTVDIKILEVPEDVRKSVGEKFKIREFTIPAGSYKNQDKDVKTLTLGAVLIVNEDMSENEAYELTKAIVENIESIQKIHPSMNAFSSELLTTEAAAPFHEGALRLYREKGLIP